MRLILLVLPALFFCSSCKDDNEPDPVSQGPIKKANGWSYLGHSSVPVNSEDNSYQLFLFKIHNHPDAFTDVFYSVKYKMINYIGGGDHYFFSNSRWISDAKGQVLRNMKNPGEFNENTGDLYSRVPFDDDYMFVKGLDVDVYGLGEGEFFVYNPTKYYPDIYFQTHSVAGSPSPRSVISNPVCHLGKEGRLVQTNQTVSMGANLFMAYDEDSDLSYLIQFHTDSLLFIVNAVTPHVVNDKTWGEVRVTQGLFARKLLEVIPNWDRSQNLELIPCYFSYPEGCLFIVQNAKQLFVIRFDTKIFKFEVLAEYAQPRSTKLYSSLTHGFQWIPDRYNSFLFTEKTGQGVRAILHRSGNTVQVQLPEFEESIVPGIMDIRYDNQKLWLITMGTDGLHLLSKVPE